MKNPIERDGAEDAQPASDSPPALKPLRQPGKRYSPEAKALADRLKRRLEERGVTVWPRDWHLKAMASATYLLRALSVADVEALMDWVLTHPFWGPKTTDMHRLVAVAAEWQQARQHQPVSSARARATPYEPMTVADRNAALLRRLYEATLHEQEEMPYDASG